MTKKRAAYKEALREHLGVVAGENERLRAENERLRDENDRIRGVIRDSAVSLAVSAVVDKAREFVGGGYDSWRRRRRG